MAQTINKVDFSNRLFIFPISAYEKMTLIIKPCFAILSSAFSKNVNAMLN